jgi:hypothetical protein
MEVRNSIPVLTSTCSAWDALPLSAAPVTVLFGSGGRLARI